MSENGWLACPDNLAFDSQGRIWIATDQGGSQKDLKIGDGLTTRTSRGAAAPGRASSSASPSEPSSAAPA